MRAYSAVILVVVLGGCDQPVVPAVDSGPRADGSVDAGSSRRARGTAIARTVSSAQGRSAVGLVSPARTRVAA